MVNTPYDDAFRTLVNECSPLLLPVLNEMFGTEYTGKEKIIFSHNERFLKQEGGEEEKRITDSVFIVVAEECKRYHLECESTNDKTVLKRMYEYGAQIAMEFAEIEGNILKAQMPAAAILSLRGRKSSPDRLEIEIGTPGGGKTAYGLPVMKMIGYGIGDIFRKKLLFVIPFYIFNHEQEFQKYEEDEEKLEELCGEYREIWHCMDDACREGVISEYIRCTLVAMSIRVMESIAANYENVRKGVRNVMGGQILEYQARTIKNEGRREGREEERALIKKVLHLNATGKMADEIARVCGISPIEVQEILAF